MLQERFHALDGYALDAQVGTVLTGLGFGKEDWSRQVDEFSGGWQMRIALAKLLLAKPNLLLLDEPTNHLDLETRNWLEDYLHDYPFGYILISHDRYFLDVTIDRTVEIWNKRLTIFQGNYTKYLSQKDERRAQLTGGIQEPARPDRASRGVHQSLPCAGDEGQAGAVADQGTGKDRAHRDSRRRAGDSLQVSAACAVGTHGGGSGGAEQELRGEARVQQRAIHASSAATGWRWWA